MADNRRATRSTRSRGNDGQQTEAQFLNTIPDPTGIERGRAEVLDLVYAASNCNGDTSNQTQQNPSEVEAVEIGNINEVTNYTASTIPPVMALFTYVNDDGYEGLEEQFLTQDEAIEDEFADITANQVVTPQGLQTSDGPLNLMYTQQMTGADRDLDTQPSQGPRNLDMSIGDTLNAYMDDDYNDILHTSQMKTSFSLLSLNNTIASKPLMPLGWIVPDCTNRTLEEISEKKIANGISSGGGTGAVIICLPQLEKNFTTKYFLLDLDMTEVFAYISQLWRHTGLFILC